jgi:hypothetical protein
VLQEKGIKERNLAKVLRKVEDLVVRSGVRELSESLEEPQKGRHEKVELKCAQDVVLQLQHFFLGELVL